MDANDVTDSAAPQSSDERLRELAELQNLSSLCGCRHAVRRHVVFRYCGACGCSRVHDSAEVEATFARMVAERVAALLGVKGEAASGETLWWLAGSGLYSCGFTGFAASATPGAPSAKVASSRYAPGSGYVPGSVSAIVQPQIEGPNARRTQISWWDSAHRRSSGYRVVEAAEAADLSWGAEREALRRYVTPRIVTPRARLDGFPPSCVQRRWLDSGVVYEYDATSDVEEYGALVFGVRPLRIVAASRLPERLW